MESIQVYDGIGEGLPPEILAIIEENKKLKKEIECYEDTIKRLQKEIRGLRNMDGEGNIPYKKPYIPYKNPYKTDGDWVKDDQDIEWNNMNIDDEKKISEKKIKSKKK
jgi:hypothetical protein